MSNYGEGVIEIPLEEFWDYVRQYHDHSRSDVLHGVPRVNNSNGTMEIDYMFNSEIPVTDEFGYESSKIKKQWDELKEREGVGND